MAWRERFRRVKTSTVVPPPPPNFEVVDEGGLSKTPPPGSENRITTFSFEILPPSKLKLEKKVYPTWIGILGRKMDEREERREGESGG